MTKRDLGGLLGESLAVGAQKPVRGSGLLARSTSGTPALSVELVEHAGFSAPAGEMARIERARDRLLAGGVAASKSEVLRVALALLDELTNAQLAQRHAALLPVKRGRK